MFLNLLIIEGIVWSCKIIGSYITEQMNIW